MNALYFDTQSVIGTLGTLFWILLIAGVIIGAFFLIRGAVKSGMKAAMTEKDKEKKQDIKDEAP